jgi:hypothetical protein
MNEAFGGSAVMNSSCSQCPCFCLVCGHHHIAPNRSVIKLRTKVSQQQLQLNSAHVTFISRQYQLQQKSNGDRFEQGNLITGSKIHHTQKRHTLRRL